jgi:hypothetical protein
VNANAWFDKGIAIRGLRSGLTEVMPEPYSARSAARLARSYAVIWREAIEWWPVGVAPDAWRQPFVGERPGRSRAAP